MDSTNNHPGTLRAGAAQVDVTPNLGAQIGPKGLDRPAHLVLDPLFAKALVLEQGGRRLCMVSMDIRTVSREWTDKTKRAVAEKYGLNPDCVLIHAMQNHAAPRFGQRFISEGNRFLGPYAQFLRGESSGYSEFILDRLVEVIGKAIEALEPADLAVGSGLENRVAFNRRMVMRDGTVRTLSLKAGDPDILCPEGPVDPELGVLSVTTKSLRMAALLLHHTCHPTHGNGGNAVTAGFPGAWSAEMQAVFGADAVPLVLNGCCGNIHSRNRLNPDYHHNDDHRRLGRWLGETTMDVLKHRMAQIESPVLDYRTRTINIPYRELPAEAVDKARTLLAEHPEPMWTNAEHTSIDWAWLYAITMLELAESHQAGDTEEYVIQGFRIGNTAILGLGGEPFVEAQLEIKTNSPAYRTFVAHMTTDTSGYIPTRRALERGGYETNTCESSKLAPEALEMITKASVELLRDLFGENRAGGAGIVATEHGGLVTEVGAQATKVAATSTKSPFGDWGRVG